MFRGRNVLAIGSHPDDIELGTLGTLLKYREDMNLLCCYIATVGGEGDLSNEFANRRIESDLALVCVHPDIMIWDEKVGIKREDYHFEVRRIEDIVDEHQINMVLVMSQHHTHQDHRLLHEITMTALRQTNATVLCYGLPSNTLDFNPRLFVNISGFMGSKLKSLQLHKSQALKPYMNKTYLNAFHSDPYSLSHGILHVERFEVERIFV